jgi:hypothetical protein
MGSKRPQTMAKRARELALKEKRERKQLKKADAAARRAAGEPDPDVLAEPEAPPLAPHD